MTDPAAKRRAREWLEGQHAKLAELRNAGTRDANFKVWRQTTLTLIQRIWEGDDARSTRFRRVPFSPPSTRADERATREWYERGCAEAGQFLKSLIDEVETGVSVTEPTRQDAPGSALEAAEEFYPTLTLSSDAPPPPPPPSSSNIPQLPRRLPDNAVTPVSADARESGAASRKPQSGPPPVAPEMPRGVRPPAPAAKPAGRPLKNGKKHAPKPRLKDLLGFSDDFRASDAPESEVTHDVTALETSIPPAEKPEAPRRAHPEAPREVKPEPSAASAESAPHSDDPSEAALQAALEAALGPMDDESGEKEADRATKEFLSSSPVFSSRPKPVARRDSAHAGPVVSAPARAVAALATEVASLNVPEGHRARARAALLDLARHLDNRELTWDALREAVTFMMEYPSLARRVLPMLIPYLEEAA